MQITIPFNIGDECYFLYENKICKSTIHSVQIYINQNDWVHNYKVHHNPAGTASNSCVYSFDKVFHTKEELLEDLNDIPVLE